MIKQTFAQKLEQLVSESFGEEALYALVIVDEQDQGMIGTNMTDECVVAALGNAVSEIQAGGLTAVQ